MVEGKFIDFKTYFANSKHNLEITPIGISGMTLLKGTNYEYILFSKRSGTVTQYPNYWELIPSGHIDKNYKTDTIINYKKKLEEEFEEETGLNKGVISKISTLSFIEDLKGKVCDVCCLIEN